MTYQPKTLKSAIRRKPAPERSTALAEIPIAADATFPMGRAVVELALAAQRIWNFNEKIQFNSDNC